MQGFNMGRYYPPPEDSSAPTFNRAHPLGQRARKLRSEGILTVRFEMPFAIWCGTCPKPTIIGQGVRFNAEKKKVGNYHSTPIWQFRMKHTACGGWIEIRTDPKATEYVITEGAKRRDYGDERREDEVGVLDPQERDRRREDAMAGLEGKKDEEKIKKESGQRIRELEAESDKWWKDPYEANRLVRRGFRKERKERARETQKVEDLKDRLGLDLDILPESEVDKQRAQLVEFGDLSGDGLGSALSKPLFQTAMQKPKPGSKDGNKSHALWNASSRSRMHDKHRFSDRLRQNTLAAMDPFSAPQISRTAPMTASKANLGLVKKQKPAADGSASLESAAPVSLLVNYDSD